MLWSRKQRVGTGDRVMPRHTEGWTKNLLLKVVPAPDMCPPEAGRRDTPSNDLEIHLSGYGVSINKFETQRILWGGSNSTFEL
jgi:hypothetical protein